MQDGEAIPKGLFYPGSIIYRRVGKSVCIADNTEVILLLNAFIFPEN